MAAAAIQAKTTLRSRRMIVLGSWLGALGDECDDRVVVLYAIGRRFHTVGGRIRPYPQALAARPAFRRQMA